MREALGHRLPGREGALVATEHVFPARFTRRFVPSYAARDAGKDGSGLLPSRFPGRMRYFVPVVTLQVSETPPIVTTVLSVVLLDDEAVRRRVMRSPETTVPALAV